MGGYGSRSSVFSATVQKLKTYFKFSAGHLNNPRMHEVDNKNEVGEILPTFNLKIEIKKIPDPCHKIMDPDPCNNVFDPQQWS